MEKSKRNYSIDLLKFISMFGIIMVHLIGQGGLLRDGSNDLELNIYRVINNILLVSVNIFCIITGYLYVGKKVNYRRIIDIIGTMLFYSIIITSIFYIFNFFNVRSMGKTQILYSIFPPMIGRYWFITCYIFLFFMINYINKFLEMLDKNQCRKMLILLFVLFSLFTELGLYDYFRIDWGYSPFWLIFLYMVGWYIKKHGLNISVKKSIGYLVLFEIINIAVMLITKNFLNKNNLLYNLGNSYNSPLMTINSVLIFWIIVNLNIKNNIFAKLGEFSLCVIILHGHRLIFDHVINNNMLFIKDYNFAIELAIIFGIAIAIYLGCVIIEIIKKKLFSITRIEKANNRLGDCLNNLLID